MGKSKIDLTKKIAIVEDFINRRMVGHIKSIHIAHLQNYKNTKRPDEIHLKRLNEVFNDMLLTIEKNSAIRETELLIYKEA